MGQRQAECPLWELIEWEDQPASADWGRASNSARGRRAIRPPFGNVTDASGQSSSDSGGCQSYGSDPGCKTHGSSWSCSSSHGCSSCGRSTWKACSANSCGYVSWSSGARRGRCSSDRPVGGNSRSWRRRAWCRSGIHRRSDRIDRYVPTCRMSDRLLRPVERRARGGRWRRLLTVFS